MAENYTADSSVATSASTAAGGCWWQVDPHASCSLSSWSTNTSSSWQLLPYPNSNSSGGDQDDVSISTSFTNVSNQSGLSQTASTNELIGEAASDNHIWSQVFINGCRGGLHNSQEVGDSLQNLSTGTFEPAYDYLKKMDNTWELTSSASFNNFDKQFNGFNDNLIENQRSSKLSNLFNSWSLAPPCSSEVNQHQQQFHPRACNTSLGSEIIDHQHQYSQTDLFDMKQTVVNSMANTCGSVGLNNHTTNSFPCYGGQDVKLEGKHRDIETAAAGVLFRKSLLSTGNGFQTNLNMTSVIGESGKYYNGMGDLPSCPNSRNFGDVFSFGSCVSKPALDINEYKPGLKNLNLSDCRKHALQTSTSKYQTGKNIGRQPGIPNEGKKKRSEENLENILKKPKQETSAASSAKVQVPKVKLSEKITSLQQIVSPFGKTDTASVLWDAIGYIKFLQEQVQLLSSPYMKTNSNKDPWGGLDRKEKEVKVDLMSRGLCLVPISCTPQVYRENTGPDYWTPAYRGCMYR